MQELVRSKLADKRHVFLQPVAFCSEHNKTFCQYSVSFLRACQVHDVSVGSATIVQQYVHYQTLFQSQVHTMGSAGNTTHFPHL
jgi:hypothetical protein